MKKGSLIVIEGTDGSGKQTQSKMLVERLNAEGYFSTTMSFPRYNTPTGRIIGQTYLGKNLREYGWLGDTNWFNNADKVDPLVASLYYAADRRAAAREMEKILNSGTNLVLDRYYQSNMAHQGGKIEIDSERMRIFDFIQKLEIELLKIPEEKAVIFLYMPLEVASILRENRGETPDGHESNIEHLKRAEKTYLQLSEYYWWKWKRIDCAPENTLKSKKEIHEEVYKTALEIIGK